MPTVHRSVLLHEVVEGLAQSPAAKTAVSAPWYLDGTLGGAGHAVAMFEAFKGKLGIVGLDRDPQAIARAEDLLKSRAEDVVLECIDYRHLGEVLDRHGIETVECILLDLGMSSDQLEASGRGFSFQRDEPLIATFGDPSAYPFTARDIVNGWKEEDIANVIFGYAEERFARRIAKAIVAYRRKKPIETSMELAEIVRLSVPGFLRSHKTHPATKTFQALRIAVNDELNALRDGLSIGYDRLSRGGRMAVISFHSLEDRIVKNFFKQQTVRDGAGIGKVLHKKPVTASAQEIAENPRSRSAKLRIIEKVQ